MSKIIVTGGSGFIGNNVFKYYLTQGHEVLNIDRQAPKNTSSKYWINIDITDYPSLKEVIVNFKPEYIIHLAARTDLNGKTIQDYESNTLGTKNLANILNEISSVKRVIFTSSMLVCKPGNIPTNEFDYSPSTKYGESKVQMERIIRGSTLKYEWAVVRPTSIWGPGFGVPYRNFFDLLINKRYFHISTKSCTKTYGYIENIIYQINQILNAPIQKIQGKTFYLGDYEPTNIQVWADEIAAQLNISIQSIPLSLIKIAANLGDILKLLKINFPMTSFRLNNMTTDNIVDLSNTKEIAPNLPFTRIEGIQKTLEWLKQ